MAGFQTSINRSKDLELFSDTEEYSYPGMPDMSDFVDREQRASTGEWPDTCNLPKTKCFKTEYLYTSMVFIQISFPPLQPM